MSWDNLEMLAPCLTPDLLKGIPEGGATEYKY